MSLHVLSVPEFYTRLHTAMHQLDPNWMAENWQEQILHEREMLAKALGEAAGRRLLDCSCGSGGQAIPLAQLGWQVTATDITPASLTEAIEHAQTLNLEITFRACDMRELSQHFHHEFDVVISCMALDNILEDDALLAALQGMRHVLKKDGVCYLRLRDFDHILAVQPRYEVKEERLTPAGQVLRLEDWEYESQRHLICTWILLCKQSTFWQTQAFSWRRRALRKAELQQMLLRAGFADIAFLPQVSPWHPYEVLAYTSALK